VEISVSEKRKWVSDLIYREIKRFEEDTHFQVEAVCVRRLDGRITSVDMDIQGSNGHEPR